MDFNVPKKIKICVANLQLFENMLLEYQAMEKAGVADFDGIYLEYYSMGEGYRAQEEPTTPTKRFEITIEQMLGLLFGTHTIVVK